MIAYLNGEYLPVEDAKISPLDRGFLFGDGIYEAIPSYGGSTVALQLHIDRMKNGLAAIGIENPLTSLEPLSYKINCTTGQRITFPGEP